MSRKLLYLILGLILLIVTTASYLTYQYHRAVYCPLDRQSSNNLTLIISPGESGLDVAKKLHEKELIRSVTFARIFFRLQQRNGRFLQAGEYQVSSRLSLAQMYDLFQHGTFDLKITIPEGKRLEEIAQAISKDLDITPEQFVNVAQDKRGYLFPDTYIVPQDISTESLIDLMIKNFNQKADSELQQGFQKQGLTLDEAVTLSSIVEREAKFDQDRPLIAGILIKRFKNGWLLEADATVQFAKANLVCNLTIPCNWWENNLSVEDLKIESPYNTRLYDGLPPTPICSPGLKSLKAIAQPKDSPYWFYLSDKSGKTYYSVSYAEHLLKIERYLRP